MCKATDGCNRPGVVVVDAERNADGKGMVNVLACRQCAAEYPKWQKWNAKGGKR